MTTMEPSCARTRRHKWSNGTGGPGASCVGCGKPWVGRGGYRVKGQKVTTPNLPTQKVVMPPPPPAYAVNLDPLRDRVSHPPMFASRPSPPSAATERRRALWSQLAGLSTVGDDDGPSEYTGADSDTDYRPPPATDVQPAPSAVVAPPPDDSLWRMAGSLLTGGYVAALAKVMKSRGYIANDPDPAAVERMEKGIAAQLARWFPDTALTPGKEIVVGAVFIGAGMCLGAQPDPEAQQRRKQPVTDAPAVDTSTLAPTPQTITPDSRD